MMRSRARTTALLWFPTTFDRVKKKKRAVEEQKNTSTGWRSAESPRPPGNHASSRGPAGVNGVADPGLAR